MNKGLILGLGVLGGAVAYMVWKNADAPSGSAGAIGRNAGRRCPPVNLPAPAGSTDFDGMPPGFREVYEAPMYLQVSGVTRLNQEAAAMGAEELALQAECAGYAIVAQKLTEKARLIRSWTPASL